MKVLTPSSSRADDRPRRVDRAVGRLPAVRADLCCPGRRAQPGRRRARVSAVPAERRHRIRDATQHPYFAGHGYASIRVDMRGTGNSDGILIDEYLPQEQEDGCEVIAWLAAQPWCSGSRRHVRQVVGRLQRPADRRAPAAGARAVVSAYSTDDRYADDVHYMGGCVLAHEALSWASYMLGTQRAAARPGDRRRALARDVARAACSERRYFLEAWMRHQRPRRVLAPGLDLRGLRRRATPPCCWSAAGPTATRNAAGRALAGLAGAGVPCRGLIGPWSHGWPHVAEPGPRIGFLQECAALVGSLAPRSRRRRHRRAAAARLDAGPCRARGSRQRDAPGPLGRRAAWPLAADGRGRSRPRGGSLGAGLAAPPGALAHRGACCRGSTRAPGAPTASRRLPARPARRGRPRARFTGAPLARAGRDPRRAARR